MFGLPEQTVHQITNCLTQFPEIQWAKIYGSRAKGNYGRGSDIDLAFSSPNDLTAELSMTLDNLPTPYMFDVTHYETLQHTELKSHIDRVGIIFYEAKHTNANP